MGEISEIVPEERVKRNGCRCGYPLDSCNNNFAEGQSCGKAQHDREAERFAAKMGLEQKAEEARREYESLKHAASVIKVNEE